MDIAKKKKKNTKIRCPPPYRDHEQPVVRQGWLYKLSSRIKVWKKRWFVVSNYCLFYYKDSGETELLGSILLPSYQIRPNNDSYQKYSFKAEHQNVKSVYLATDTLENMKLWMNDLARASIMINSFSGLDLPSGDEDSGFTSYNSKAEVQWEASPYHQHYSRSNENLLADPLYANAPPKPKRTYDIEELYRLYANEGVAKQPPRPQSADFLEKGDHYPEKSKFRGSADDLTEPRQESMKRLLEWKQRMLQSPLTRGATRSTAATPALSFHHQQVLRDVQNHNAARPVNLIDLPPKPVFPKPKPSIYQEQPEYVNCKFREMEREKSPMEEGPFFRREDLYRASQMFYSPRKELIRPMNSSSSSSMSSVCSRPYVWALDKDVGLPLPSPSHCTDRSTPRKLSASPATATSTSNLVQERIKHFEKPPSKENSCTSLTSSASPKKTYEKTPMGSLKNNNITLSPLSSVLADLRKTADSGSSTALKVPSFKGSQEGLYDLRPQPSLKGSQDGLYNMRSSLKGSQDGLYNMRSSLKGSQDGLYNMRSSLKGSQDGLYNMRSSLKGSQDGLYNMRSSLKGSQDGLYSMRSSLKGSQEGLYDLRPPPSLKGSQEVLYKKRPSLKGSQDGLYNMRSSLKGSQDGLYNMRSSLKESEEGLYAIRPPSPSSFKKREDEEEAYISMNSISEDEPVYVSMDEPPHEPVKRPDSDSLDYSSSSETLYKTDASSCTLKPYHKFLSKNLQDLDKDSNASDADDEASRDFNNPNLAAAKDSTFSSYVEDNFDQYGDDLDNYEKVQNLYPPGETSYVFPPHYYTNRAEDSPDIIPVNRTSGFTNSAPYYYSDIYEPTEPSMSRPLLLSGISHSEDCLATVSSQRRQRSATPDFDLVTQREATEPCYENVPSLSQRLSRSLEGLTSDEPLYENVFADAQATETHPEKESSSKDQAAASELNESFMTAGDLLNKSHEELVLLLISLRRQQASLEREMEAEQEGSNHWRLLDSRHKAGESLVSLVDSMVKLGTLYDGTATPLNDPKPPSSSPPLPPWPDLELPEAELAQTSQFYQEKLEEFARIDQSIQEELRIFSSFEKERAVLEQLLDSPLSGPQRQQFQREIDELESRLAACRRRVMLLVEEDQSLGQELSMLRSHLLNICSPTQETKIEKMLQELAQRKHALAQAHREVRASPTGLAGAHPLPPGKRKPNTYLETDLDSMVSRDLATGADVAATADTQALYENAPPQPVEELSYMQDISEADDKVKRFYGIIPREKPAEVKTVRIVKRESERRNRGKKEISWQDMEDAKDSKDIVVKQRMRRRRHNTVVGIPELPTQPPSPARARDDTDLALCLKTVNTPDIVRSTIKKSPFVFDDKLIDQVLGLPQKISIPERYVEVEETEPLSASEKLKRTLKAENIKKMLTSTSVEAVPDREQGRKLLTLNHTLAREVVERSKMVAAHTSPPSTQQLPKC